MVLDDLLKEAKKIRGALEQKRAFIKKGITNFNYFSIDGRYLADGVYREGHYFGIGCSLRDVIAMEEKKELPPHYCIRITTGLDDTPKIIDISDGSKAYRLVYQEGFFSSGFKIIELDGAFRF